MERITLPQLKWTARECVQHWNTIASQCSTLYAENKWNELESLAQDLADAAWERLHHTAWQQVEPDWRELFAFASTLQCAVLLQQNKALAAMRVVDMALLMGAPEYFEMLENVTLHVSTLLRISLLHKSAKPKQTACNARTSLVASPNDVALNLLHLLRLLDSTSALPCGALLRRHSKHSSQLT
jgi:hypothetical protein